MADFYDTLAQISFTMFGLWLIVVELRLRGFAGHWRDRWGARAVALHFALPGIMSLMTLANPDSKALWRISFAVFALLGAGAVALLGPRRDDLPLRIGQIAHWAGVALYIAVAYVAAFPTVLADPLNVTPLQIESVLLSLVIFVGLNLAFSYLFAGVEPESTDDTGA